MNAGGPRWDDEETMRLQEAVQLTLLSEEPPETMQQLGASFSAFEDAEGTFLR